MDSFLEFKNPYNIYIARNMITSVKQHGTNILISTSDGGVHKINEKDYTLNDVMKMCVPTAKSASTSTPTKSKATKKSLDN